MLRCLFHASFLGLLLGLQFRKCLNLCQTNKVRQIKPRGNTGTAALLMIILLAYEVEASTPCLGVIAVALFVLFSEIMNLLHFVALKIKSIFILLNCSELALLSGQE